jgi:hypothetical protein
MKCFVKLLLAAAVGGAATHAAAAGFQCTNESGTKVGVDLDPGARLMTVTRADGVVDQGYFVTRAIPDAAYNEYYLMTDYSDAYYFRLWKDGVDRAEFQFCWGCAVFVCNHKDDFLGL